MVTSIASASDHIVASSHLVQAAKLGLSQMGSRHAQLAELLRSEYLEHEISMSMMKAKFNQTVLNVIKSLVKAELEG
ncbi:hypothetical protein CV023_15070 [Brevibacterium sp. CCUG 69071]|nr:hypothetical protein [Brevibacterium sp. CCUG 69071]